MMESYKRLFWRIPYKTWSVSPFSFPQDKMARIMALLSSTDQIHTWLPYTFLSSSVVVWGPHFKADFANTGVFRGQGCKVIEGSREE